MKENIFDKVLLFITFEVFQNFRQIYFFTNLQISQKYYERLLRLMVSKLQANREVLGYFLHIHKAITSTKETAKTVFDRVKDFWKNARIPIRQDRKCCSKIEDLYKEYHKIKKLQAN